MTRRALIACAVGGTLLAAGVVVYFIRPSAPKPTFSRDVAPIVYAHCAQCHREGGVGPFPLIEYADVKKRARQIVEVTGSHVMPPWLPEPAEPGADFIGERRLPDAQIEMLRRWVQAGAPEGNRSDLPPQPGGRVDWPLGDPDLVVTMPESFTLPAEGADVYQNFVVPIPLEARRFVRAIDMRPGNPRIVHHAFLLLDRTGGARRRDAEEAGTGFAGMNPGAAAETPGGHFLSWSPGKLPAEEVKGTQWSLEPATDAILQLHMKPTGKPEEIRASVAFYFTDDPPTKHPLRLLLRSTEIDIPPGEKDYVIESSYTVPVAIDVLALLPHTHYLGRDLHGWAELPGGATVTLIRIKQWDFNWQGDYRFAKPLSLPAGTTLRMRYRYDNSAGNAFNQSPPQRVQYGEQTRDEMGELWLQVLAHDPNELGKLEADYEEKWMRPDAISRARTVLARNPGDVQTRTNLGGILFLSGDLESAEQELRRVLESDPNFALAYSHLAHLYMQRNDAPRAKDALEKVVALTPDDFRAQNSLGHWWLVAGDARRAQTYFERAVAINPNDPLVRANLARARSLIERADSEKRFREIFEKHD